MKSQLEQLRQRDSARGSNEQEEQKQRLVEDHHTAAKLDVESSVHEPLREELDLLNQKINEEYQTKVESSSRYRVRLSGMFLVNFFGNRGSVDNIESPIFPILPAENQSNGSFGGTIRQSQLGLQVVGPNFLNARTSGQVQMDFAGGFSDGPGGSTVGLPRLRTGTVRLDWKNTSLVAGQDGLFFSPRDPTSFASLEMPALAYSGNLWGWAPQIRVEHRFGSLEHSAVTIEGGILDPISGELPSDGNNRDVGVGEASVQPGFASHIGWSRPSFHKPLRVGVGAYRGRQNWQVSPTNALMTSWLVSTDWDLPVSHWSSISGSFYRGKSIGAFGGGIGQSIVRATLLGATNSLTQAQAVGIGSMGGWAQLKIQPLSKIEFNTAVGLDNPYAHELRIGPAQSYSGASLFRDRTTFSNIIYRPRSNLLLSLELRHIRAVEKVDDSIQSANHINMSLGILF